MVVRLMVTGKKKKGRGCAKGTQLVLLGLVFLRYGESGSY